MAILGDLPLQVANLLINALQGIGFGAGGLQGQIAQLERLPRFDRNRLAEYGRDQGWGDGVRLYR